MLGLRESIGRWCREFERGQLELVSLRNLRRVAAVLEARIGVVATWRGGDLPRLVNARHSALHEATARLLARQTGWQCVPEVSYAILGERGTIDWLCWHAVSGALLVIELKTEIVDAQAVLAQIDRYLRLAPAIAARRDWRTTSVSVWLLIAEGRTNRRHVAAHHALFTAAFPDRGPIMRRWLRRPDGSVRAISFLQYVQDGTVRRPPGGIHRVTKAGTRSPRA